MNGEHDSSSRPIRFGTFELNADTGELRKRGIRLRLSDAGTGTGLATVEIRDLTYFNRHITGHADYFYAKLCAAPAGLAAADGIPYETGPCRNPVAGASGAGSSR